MRFFATEALAGIPPDGAAGSNFESLSQLNCTIDPNAHQAEGRQRGGLRVPAGELSRGERAYKRCREIAAT